MKTISQFAVIILAILIGLIVTSCSLTQTTYHVKLKPSYQGNVCLSLGELDGTLDITLERGANCDRFRISSHNPTYHYLQIPSHSSLESQFDLTISSPRLGGSYQRDKAGYMRYGDCQKGWVHTLEREQPHRDNSVAVVAGIFILISMGCLFGLLSAINKVYCWSSSQFISLSQLQPLMDSNTNNRYVKVTGKIQCENSLTSPLAQQPCVYYSFCVKRKYELPSSKSNKNQEEIVFEQKETIPFTLEQGKYRIRVIANHAEITTKNHYHESRNEPPQSYSSSNKGFTRGFQYGESILPVGASVTVVGLATPQGIVHPQQSNGFAKRFLITTQTESEFSHTARNTIVLLTLLMLFFSVLGSRQAIFSLNFWQMSATEACRLHVQSWF
jgi:hypothetical protein